ncbi:MAG: hypothetical protein PW788_09600 [Micavibrio sp.]|nr:hypothetical protein [Micavibrio sp.]
MTQYILAAILLLWATPVFADQSDDMICMIAQQYAMSMKQGAIPIDDKVTMSGAAVDCAAKTVYPSLKVGMTMEAANANPNYHQDWHKLYCESDGIYRQAADRGWAISANVTYLDGSSRIVVQCNRIIGVYDEFLRTVSQNLLVTSSYVRIRYVCS